MTTFVDAPNEKEAHLPFIAAFIWWTQCKWKRRSIWKQWYQPHTSSVLRTYAQHFVQSHRPLVVCAFFRFSHNKTQRSAKCVHDQNGAFLIQTCESMSNSLIDDDVAFDWVRRRISYRETQYNGDGQFSSTLEKDYNRIRIFRYVKSHRAHLCIRAQRSAARWSMRKLNS